MITNPCAEMDMTKLETIHAKPQFVGKLYGVELEIEADGLYCVEEIYDEEGENYTTTDPCVPSGWLREQEDSIQGVELISERPFDLETSIDNIERVFADIERQHYIPTRTPRGSTHVHANVADLTWEQMRSFIMACAWAEPALIELAGRGRKGNLFAQSYETTPIGWLPVIDSCRKKFMDQVVDTHYMATSFYPMSYLGSVEFRMGPSSRTAEEAIRWLKCIDCVVAAGRTETIGLDQPTFLDVLLSKVSEKRRLQLIRKGSQQAAEIFFALAEPYEVPVPRTGRKKSAQLIQDLMNASNYLNQPEPGLNPYIVQSGIISEEELADSWNTAPAPELEVIYDPPLKCDCGSPTCPINFPINSPNNSFLNGN